jgi:hypothetical protein
MDELDVQGKKYISSKRGAELTGYAKDYIGQLARAGKVPGTRFGRAWFVEEAALLKHLGAEVAQTETEHVDEAPVVVLAPAVTQAKKPLLSHHMITPSALPKTWSAVQYLNDDSDLFPVITPRIVDVPIAPKVIAEEVKKPPVEIKVPVHVAPSAVSVEKRVAALVDGIRPRSAVLRVAPIAPATRKVPELKKIEEVKIQKPLRKSIPVRWSPGSFANVAAVFILIFGSLASFSLMKNISLGGTEALTASSIYGLTDFLEVLQNARIFDAGVEAIRSFYMMFVQSFSMYLKTGLDFIVELL